ncbi:Na+/H+ antiporter family protein [Corynebacterium propinquum]|uniref:Na+/H+ antiporter NhaC family protein n=1 Tax=Corynebacterium propinquum TaxID=43769 RepID=A0ABT7G1C3_9CORY|nr:Na+/H+ antiporter NhaC family protein [Corynebacterium propinquum]MDK4300532.1 Na+/H+ antiporter NhaC family protein [Corynebacterium propinquum]QQU86268.1 TRAP transporter large permease subunit [Corynebacterium propinquum]
MNAVIIAVVVMLGLAVARVHVVLALLIGAIVGGLVGGLGIDGSFIAFQEGIGNGASIALNYALLGAFALAIANAGLPRLLAESIINRIDADDEDTKEKAVAVAKWLTVAGLLLMAIMSQNLVPVHIAFIPLIVPPLLSVLNKMQLDRRLITCVLTFGLVTTYFFVPVGFGNIYMNDILRSNIVEAGMPEANTISVMQAMAIPALGMLVGVLFAIFVSYRKKRVYKDIPISEDAAKAVEISRYRITISIIALVATFGVQIVLQYLDSDADSLLAGALVGLAIMLAFRGVEWKQSDDIYTEGMRMMALIGFIMITAQGFANVMAETGDVETLVESTAAAFDGNQALASLAMLLVGLVVTMGIGSSFSTLPIISTIYVPLCISLGFSPLATVALVGTAGALGDAGSPASDSTLGPTSGLNVDGQHDHIRDSVIPTFLHFNIPLIAFGWAATMLL